MAGDDYGRRCGEGRRQWVAGVVRDLGLAGVAEKDHVSRNIETAWACRHGSSISANTYCALALLLHAHLADLLSDLGRHWGRWDRRVSEQLVRTRGWAEEDTGASEQRGLSSEFEQRV